MKVRSWNKASCSKDYFCKEYQRCSLNQPPKIQVVLMLLVLLQLIREIFCSRSRLYRLHFGMTNHKAKLFHWFPELIIYTCCSICINFCKLRQSALKTSSAYILLCNFYNYFYAMFYKNSSSALLRFLMLNYIIFEVASL